MMNAIASCNETLRAENAELRGRLEEAEEVLRAIRTGEVDALIVETAAGPQLFTLLGVDAEQNRMRGEMLAQVSDAVIATDLDQHVTFVNASAERQMGIRAGDVLGRALTDIYIEQWENPAAEPAMRTAMRERGECRCELIHHMHNGQELQVENSIGTLRAADGTPIGYVKAIRDVTERKQLEREKAETLRLLDTLLAHAPVGFVFLDRDLRFVRINERLAEINGISVAAHLGRPMAELLPTLEPALRAVTARILATGQPVLDHEFAGETPLAPGVTRYWSQNWYPVRDKCGEIMGFGGVVEEITQRKQTEAALRLLNDRFELAVKCTRAMLWQQDLELRFTWMHKSTPGIDGSDAVGKRDEDLLERAEDAVGIVALKREVIRSGVGLRQEVFPQIQGVVHCFELLMEPLRDATGLITGLTGAAIDITERKRAEAAHENSEQHLRYALQAAAAGAWDWNIRSGDIIWSPENYRLYDVDPSQGPLNYADWESRLHPEDRDRVNENVRAVVKGRKAELRTEFRVLSRQGAVRWLLSVGRLEFDGDGQPLRMSGLNLDISARIQAEAVTKDSETRYRRLFESAKDGILILDAHAGTITDANPFITELLGYSPEELQGKELWQIGLFQDVEASKVAMKELQETGYIRYEDLPLETKAGQRIHVEFISNLYCEGGEAVIQCNIRDISDRKRLEEILRQRAAELSETDRRKDVFLATLAHELRNPLAPIRSGLQILKLPEVDVGTIEKTRSMMERQVEQMTRLIDDLMDLSRINQGKIVLQKTRIPLADAIRNAVDTSQPLIDTQRHKLFVDMPPEPIYLDGDLSRLSQVFANLLNNSAKYTDCGGRIQLAVERKGNDAVVSLTDNGVGIPADMLAHVFDMFSQIDGSLEKSQGGLGIGLNIVKRLVEMHGGSIDAESGGPCMGSTFTVKLPLALSVTDEISEDQSASQLAKPAARRILVVDDNKDGAFTLAMMLKLMGNVTQIAHDGLEAVVVSEAFRPDLILMDIGMPKLNGYDACRRIREHPWADSVVLVALTGWGQEEDRQKSKDAGFNGHLVKPVDHAALIKLLANS